MPEYATTQQFESMKDSIDRKIGKIEKIVFGNGDPGLDEQIRNISRWIEEQKKIAERRRAWWDKLQWVVIPIAISGIFAFFYQVFVFYFRIVPLLETIK